MCGCGGNRESNCCKIDQNYEQYCGATQTEMICSGTTSDTTDIISLGDNWVNYNCPEVYQSILYDNDGTLEYNSNNLSRVQAGVDSMIQTYLNFGFEFTDSVTSPSYNRFQDQIIDMCSNDLVPGSCDLFLENYCQQLTYDEMSASKTLSSLCGCYINSPYFGLDTGDGTLPPQCQPLCHRVDSAQISDPCTGNIATCDNTVCIIDSVDISLDGTDAPVSFQQLCPGCDQEGSDPCTCIIGGSDISDSFSDSSIQARYTQYCGDNSQCYIIGDDDQLIPTDCPQLSDITIPPSAYTLPIIMIAIIGVIIIIVIIAFLATKKSNRSITIPTSEMWQPQQGSSLGRTSSIQYRS